MVRFMAKVSVVPITGCWLWLGALNEGNYSVFYGKHAGEKFVSGHRYAYAALVGPIGHGLTLDHLCRNTWCVNPAHLEPVTIAENLRRGSAPPAINGRRTVCKNGHAFTHQLAKRRKCGVCMREYKRQFRIRQKAALAAAS
jgi:hypothetical protein